MTGTVTLATGDSSDTDQVMLAKMAKSSCNEVSLDMLRSGLRVDDYAARVQHAHCLKVFGRHHLLLHGRRRCRRPHVSLETEALVSSERQFF